MEELTEIGSNAFEHILDALSQFFHTVEIDGNVLEIVEHNEKYKLNKIICNFKVNGDIDVSVTNSITDNKYPPNSRYTFQIGYNKVGLESRQYNLAGVLNSCYSSGETSLKDMIQESLRRSESYYSSLTNIMNELESVQ